MVVGSTVVEGVAGGELRGGGGFGWFRIYELRWSLVESEALGSSARPWGNVWWCWMDGGGPGCDVLYWIAAATELAGGGEESFPTSIAG